MVTAGTSTIVILTDEEWRLAVEMGNRRNRSAKGQQETDGRYNSSTAFGNHVWGAGGEIATAKYYEVKWDATINVYRSIPDLLGCEVRSADVSEPFLRIKKTDLSKKSWPFVFATHSAPKVYQIEGWCYGFEGLRLGVWRVNKFSKQRECHVSIRKLRPAFTLQTMLWKLRDYYESRSCSNTGSASIPPEH